LVNKHPLSAHNKLRLLLWRLGRTVVARGGRGGRCPEVLGQAPAADPTGAAAGEAEGAAARPGADAVLAQALTWLRRVEGGLLP
jgi:hypothetical protein